MSVKDWMRSRENWARVLGVEAGELAPGAKIGPPTGICTSAIGEDVVHPVPGEVWINSRVQEVLAGARFTGVAFAKVQVSSECGDVDLAELVVQGRARRKGSTFESLRECEICGRLGFPSPTTLAVDEARWDGSDFVTLDDNPNIIIVTERVASVLESHPFSNVVVEPIE